MSFVKPRLGISAKNGKLYVFAASRVSVIKGWPDMAAWTRSKGKPQWERFRPRIDLNTKTVGDSRTRHRFRPKVQWPLIAEHIPLPGDDEGVDEEEFARICARPPSDLDLYYERVAQREMQIRADFVASIPESIRQLVSQFPTRHWHLLSMIARCEGAEEFLRANPALGFAMASCWTLAEVPSGRAMRWIRRNLPRRRRDIAATFGFPNREQSVGILSKLKPAACCNSHLLSLRTLLADSDAAKRLAHSPVVDSPMLAMMTHTPIRAVSTSRLLSQVGSGQPLPVERGMVPGMIYDFLRMCTRLNEPAQAQRRFHSVESLITAHDALAQRLIRRGPDRKLHLKFPPPPIPGTEAISPIMDVDDLFAEAREQRNCVAAYAENIAEGELYIYRMLAPERATVSLRREGGLWTIEQVAAFRNSTVSNAAHAALGSWMGIDIPF